MGDIQSPLADPQSSGSSTHSEALRPYQPKNISPRRLSIFSLSIVASLVAAIVEVPVHWLISVSPEHSSPWSPADIRSVFDPISFLINLIWTFTAGVLASLATVADLPDTLPDARNSTQRRWAWVNRRTLVPLVVFLTLLIVADYFDGQDLKLAENKASSFAEYHFPPSSAKATPLAISAQPPRDNMIYIPQGWFLRGSTDGQIATLVANCTEPYPKGVGFLSCNASSFEDEKPQASVWLDVFWIDKTDVTNQQFTAFVQANTQATPGHKTHAEITGESTVFDATLATYKSTKGADWTHPEGPGTGNQAILDHPVVHVTWDEASAYCVWTGKRLLTEAEWEKAARGTDGRVYPWGFDWFTGDPIARIDFPRSSKATGTDPVGQHPDGRSPYGIDDMLGNVAQWVQDGYAPKFYEDSPNVNPHGPETVGDQVTRGGSWGTNQSWFHTAWRVVQTHNYTSDGLGIRCGRNP